MAHGLKSAADLNGKVGIVVASVEPDTGRILVSFKDFDRDVAIKPCNLKRRSNIPPPPKKKEKNMAALLAAEAVKKRKDVRSVRKQDLAHALFVPPPPGLDDNDEDKGRHEIEAAKQIEREGAEIKMDAVAEEANSRQDEEERIAHEEEERMRRKSALHVKRENA